MKDNRIKILKWYDILVLTIIMFGDGILKSTVQYIALSNSTLTLEDTTTFTSAINYQSLALQLLWLSLATAYLLFRNFDFSVLAKKIKFKPIVIMQGIGIFIVSALALDIFYIFTQMIAPSVPSLYKLIADFDISLLLYSILNGFYEEIFFLGLCLLVKPEHIKWAFLYSLIVRCSFHTYQGIASALGIGLVFGTVLFLIYRKMKEKNLLPFFIAHTIADIIGLSILFYFWR